MEDVPPSYEYAIDREAWNIIAPWIPSSDLCSVCLVCRKWHAIFIPFLWGDPASHFGIENDAVYVALTRFKRTLRKARLSVRSLTHTLHLPPALSEIYGGPNPSWLKDVLEYLPNLQSLIVTRLPFFDSRSLVALRTPLKSGPQDADPVETSSFGLKLLLAASEPNTTSYGLAVALPRFPGLVYLDLSYTTPARDVAVLAALRTLEELQVLKLRGIGMRDGELEVLAKTIGIRVRLLDLRDNLLTDVAATSLVQTCFLQTDGRTDPRRLNSRRVEDWPIGMAPGPDFFSLDMIRSEELDHQLLNQLTHPLTGRLAFEDIPHRGLTHLYIANNHLSVEGVSCLLKSERLHVLDGGSVDSAKVITRMRSSVSETFHGDHVQFPGVEKLTPVLAKCATKTLTYLRINHALVTAKLDSSVSWKTLGTLQAKASELAGSAPLAAELPGQSSLLVEISASNHYAVEMPDSREPVFELDATPAPVRAELPGDIIHFAISPPMGEPPDVSSPVTNISSPIRGEGVYAPELVSVMKAGTSDGHHNHQSEEREEVILNASGSGLSKRPQRSMTNVTTLSSSTASESYSPLTPLSSTLSTLSSTNSNILPAPLAPARSSQSFSPAQRLSRIEALMNKRPRANQSSTKSTSQNNSAETIVPATSTYFHPCMLPYLRILVLTDVPMTVPSSSPVLPALKTFISNCADEAALATLRAQTNYSLPPGRSRQVAELEHARSLFALRTIVLEMVSTIEVRGQTERGWTHSRQRTHMSKSSTGDHDSENLWSAAQNDFSFFGEEGEEKDECGIYEHDPEKYFPTAHLDDLIPVSAEESPLPPDSPVRNSPYSHPPHASSTTNGSSNNLPYHGGTTNASLRGPRYLPLGKNRRSSNETRGGGSNDFSRPSTSHVTRTPSTLAPQLRSPTTPSVPSPLSATFPPPPAPEEPMLDVKKELASWRRARKAAYEDEVRRYRHNYGLARDTVVDKNDLPLVEGYWDGEIQIISGGGGRQGLVDVYGNYFEKGYLYP